MHAFFEDKIKGLWHDRQNVELMQDKLFRGQVEQFLGF